MAKEKKKYRLRVTISYISDLMISKSSQVLSEPSSSSLQQLQIALYYVIDYQCVRRLGRFFEFAEYFAALGASFRESLSRIDVEFRLSGWDVIRSCEDRAVGNKVSSVVSSEIKTVEHTAIYTVRQISFKTGSVKRNGNKKIPVLVFYSK